MKQGKVSTYTITTVCYWVSLSEPKRAPPLQDCVDGISVSMYGGHSILHSNSKLHENLDKLAFPNRHTAQCHIHCLRLIQHRQSKLDDNKTHRERRDREMTKEKRLPETFNMQVKRPCSSTAYVNICCCHATSVLRLTPKIVLQSSSYITHQAQSQRA